MQMVKPGSTATQDIPGADDDLVSMEELNIGGGPDLASGDEARDPGETSPSADNLNAFASFLRPDPNVVHPPFAESGSAPGTPTSFQPAQASVPPARPTRSPMSTGNPTGLPARDNAPQLRQGTRPEKATDDAAWMEVIEKHPELSYHQAEILRLTGCMTPLTMDTALARCRYLLDRMERWGPRCSERHKEERAMVCNMSGSDRGGGYGQ